MTDTPDPPEREPGRHRWRLFVLLSCMMIFGLAGMVGLVSLLPAAAERPPDSFLVVLSCTNSEPMYIKARRDIRTTDALLAAILPRHESITSVPCPSPNNAPDIALIQTLAKAPFPGWSAALADPDGDRSGLEDARAANRASVVKTLRDGLPMAVGKLRGQKSGTAGVLFPYVPYGNMPTFSGPRPDYTPSGHMFANVNELYAIWHEAGRPPIHIFRDAKEHVGTYAVTGYTPQELPDLDR